MPGQVLETSLIRPLSEFSLVFGFVAFSDFNFVYFFSFFFLHILFFPFGVPLLEINKFFYIARSAALTAFICKMSLYYDTKTIIMNIMIRVIITIILIKVIIIKLEEQKNFMVLGKKDLTKDLMATLVWFWMEIKKYTKVYIFLISNLCS